ncbi:hypothetical protein DTO012A7_2501 [Penicillium roqueforti]|nr:hypothetical protein CBS147318_3755 [Penicillium roqueforti]KAI3176716.1 hypothetical protein DTO039G3_75 [Penicillium roqueforti]KAI3228337.1 hypothetical protein DTO012A9_8834 [Penicillium roqueforti]KAI3240802.1 hypothetical protein DTO012A7_2501 [Penicillium roqueforti]KAI3268865.1 hypothetical protein CBS147309_5806 [Penicillium roqueforti]
MTTPIHSPRPSSFASSRNILSPALQHNDLRDDALWEKIHRILAFRKNVAHMVNRRDSISTKPRTREPPTTRPISHMPISHTPINHTPINHTPINYTPINPMPINHTPINHTPINHTPINHTPINHTPINHTPINRTPVDIVSDGVSDGNDFLDNVIFLVNDDSTSYQDYPHSTIKPRNSGFSDDRVLSESVTLADRSSGSANDAGYSASASIDDESSKSKSDPGVKPLPRSAHTPGLCWVCRRPFQLSTEFQDNWKCFHQPVVSNDSELPPPKRFTAEDQPAMHACCWEITCKVFECSSLNMARREDLIRCLYYMSNFAEITPFDSETNALDLELFTDPDSVPSPPEEENSQLEVLLSEVLGLLHEKDGPIGIDKLQKIDPCLAQWMKMANSYSIRMSRCPNVRLLLQRVVKNLRQSDASRFPKAYNFRVAWYNVQGVIDAMENIPQPRMILLDSRMKGRGQYARYRCVMGIPLDLVQLRTLLRVRSIFQFKFKHGGKWDHIWNGEPEHACDDVQIDWNGSAQDLVFHYDTLRKDIKKVVPRLQLK